MSFAMARRSVSIASQYGTGAAGESMVRSNSTSEHARPTKIRQENPWPWHDAARGTLGKAFLPGRLCAGIGLLDWLIDRFGWRAGIRQRTNSARADRRDALPCELVRALVHGVAGMAAHPM